MPSFFFVALIFLFLALLQFFTPLVLPLFLPSFFSFFTWLCCSPLSLSSLSPPLNCSFLHSSSALQYAGQSQVNCVCSFSICFLSVWQSVHAQMRALSGHGNLKAHSKRRAFFTSFFFFSLILRLLGVVSFASSHCLQTNGLHYVELCSYWLPEQGLALTLC